MENFYTNDNCPIRDVLSRLGDKWSMLVLVTLNANGTMRFCDVHKAIADISQRMLTVTPDVGGRRANFEKGICRGAAAGGISAHGVG